MRFTDAVLLFSGIALFLFGMKLMGDGLKKVAGSKLEPFLYKLSNTPVKGALLGTGVTAVIQSSSATSVMAVGFVNSKMMTLKQATSIIIGSILGTSITGWIIALGYLESTAELSGILSSSTLTGIVAVAGIILYMFLKDQKYRKIGLILMGFAVLMFGMSTMSESVSALGENESFRTLLQTLSNPLVGILAGIVSSAVLQSASAAVGIVQALSVTGTIGLAATVPLLMGIAVGAAVPVLISSIGASSDGKRTAFVYPSAAMIGVAVSAVLYYVPQLFISYPFVKTAADPFSVALLNTVLRFVMLLVTLPLAGFIEKFLTKLFPEKEKEQADQYPVLEDRFIRHPALAIAQSEDAVRQMGKEALNALLSAFSLIEQYTDEGFDRVKRLEELGDRYEDALGTYLLKITGQELTAAENSKVSSFLLTLSDFERLSDHALNIAESAAELNEKGIRFSPEGMREFKILSDAVSEIARLSINAYLEGATEKAYRVEPLEERIDELTDELKSNHVERLQKGICTIHQGFIFNDILTNAERISDHCSNLAVALIELNAGEFDTHKYLDRLKVKRTDEFERYYKEYRSKYKV